MEEPVRFDYLGSTGTRQKFDVISHFFPQDKKKKERSRTSTLSKQEALWKGKIGPAIVEEIINLNDLEVLKQRSDYIRVEATKKKLTTEDFDKRVEIGSWQLLTLITDRDSFAEAVIFMSDPIANMFDLDMTFENGRNFLIYAVAKAERIIIEKLIELKPNLVNKTDDFGRTAVHYAVILKKCKILSFLIESGADFMKEDVNGQTPLHLAAIRFDREIYFYLKFRGASGKVLDKVGLKPLDYIPVEQDYNDIMLMEFGSPKKTKKTGRVTSSFLIDSTSEIESVVGRFPFFNPTKAAFDRRRSYFHRLGIMKPATKLEQQDCYLDRYEQSMQDNYEHDHRKGRETSAILLSDQDEMDKNNSMPLQLSKSFRVERNTLAHKMRASCGDQYFNLGKITLRHLEIKGVIGKGSFGKIYCVSVKGSGNVFAMKSYNKQQFLSSSLVRFLFVEKKIMVNFDHPFLVKLYYSFQTQDKLFILMDYCEKRDLTKQVLKLDELQVKILACELVLAIKALHDREIIHRDIKPDNVFICSDGHVKLGDFGLSKDRIKKGSISHTFCGSIAYLPPEVVKKSGHNKSIDWYLLGELLYEVVMGVPPFYGDSKDALMENILHKELSLEDLPVSDSFKDLLSKLMNRDIHSRLGSRYDGVEVMEHPYFVGIDWNKVFQKKYSLFKPEQLESYKLQKHSISELEEKGSISDDMSLPFWSFIR